MIKSNTLILCGTGISIGQMSIEVNSALKNADIVLHSMGDPLSETYIKKINSNTYNLNDLYSDEKPLLNTYNEMVDVILKHLLEGKNVCVAFYGHPTNYVYAGKRAIQKAKELGYETSILPGISSVANLFADLNIDPGNNGCLMIEATKLLMDDFNINKTLDIIVWQIGFVGEYKYYDTGPKNKYLKNLIDKISDCYTKDYEVVIYQAKLYSATKPKIKYCKLIEINKYITPYCTLYIPSINSKKYEKIDH